MKKFTLLLWSLFLFNGCATKDLVRYDDGPLVAERQNLKKTQEPSQYEVSFEKVEEKASTFLKLNVTRNNPMKEEWEDTYTQVAVYKKHCKGWRSGGNQVFPQGFEVPYCDFSTANFIMDHILAFGFLYDLALPFMSYDERAVDLQEPSGTKIKNNSDVIDNRSPIDTKFIKLTINKVSASSHFANGVAQFSFNALKLNPEKLPSGVQASIAFNNLDLDVSEGFSNFITKEENKKEELQAAKEAEQRRPETRYKMSVCAIADLYTVIYNPYGRNTIESNCIYVIRPGTFKVLQSLNDGILVTLIHPNEYLLDKVFFIKTKKEYVDEDLVGRMLVHSIGNIRYGNVLGSQKTIHAFEYLGDD